MIGNNDSHSKNISFLLKEEKIELAPMYDLLSTAIYPELKRHFSFIIGDLDDFSRIGKNQFLLLDQALELKSGTMEERMGSLSAKVLNVKDGLAKSISSEHKAVKNQDQ